VVQKKRQRLVFLIGIGKRYSVTVVRIANEFIHRERRLSE
jgi:hypothetical protein